MNTSHRDGGSVLDNRASLFSPEEDQASEVLFRLGLQEDLGERGDITTAAMFPENPTVRGTFAARKPGVVAGLPGLGVLARVMGAELSIAPLRSDGPVVEGERLAVISGPANVVLPAERVALNFLSRLSGVATLTQSYVQAVAGTVAKICDTRKTTPGWRWLEKYAVRVGGGTNHRMGLFDAILIKDNHLAALARQSAQPVAEAVRRARSFAPDCLVEIEVDTLVQLEEALAARPDIVLLDNMTTEQLQRAVELRNRTGTGIALEASGGVHLATVRAIALTGVDRISVGALTHSAVALDIGLDFESFDDLAR